MPGAQRDAYAQLTRRSAAAILAAVPMLLLSPKGGPFQSALTVPAQGMSSRCFNSCGAGCANPYARISIPYHSAVEYCAPASLVSLVPFNLAECPGLFWRFI